jgi:hypothetical protein
MFVYGYLKYRGSSARTYKKGFVALYRPTNNPALGMFSYYDQPNYNYDK